MCVIGTYCTICIIRYVLSVDQVLFVDQKIVFCYRTASVDVYIYKSYTTLGLEKARLEGGGRW